MVGKKRYSRQVAALQKRISPASTALVITHDYPDPDCLSSAFGLSHLFASFGIASTTITFGGFVGRAENRAMIQLCSIHTMPFMLVNPADYDRIIVVDSFPGTGNLSLPPQRPIDAVLDHHPHTVPADCPFFCELRPDLGATSTMVTKYLLASKCDIPSKVATALFFGIKTDTNDMARNASDEDLECYKILFDIMDHRLLSNIESPNRDVEYFKILHRAGESMVTYKTVGYTHLGMVSTPDYIAEIADLYLSLESNEWMICSGIFRNQIFFSVRTKEAGIAGEVAEKIAVGLHGSGGGHSNMAAGRIPLNGKPAQETLDDFVRTFKAVLNVADTNMNALLSG
jgi:nanoRNase/pAp phosphatase (c-di-AMP/oligoRNAs hydrolase)